MQTLTQEVYDQLNEKEELNFTDKTRDFKLNCIARNRKVCMLALLDGRTHTPSLFKSFEKNIAATEAMITKYVNKPYSYGWVNATCHVYNL